jgi:hypothetical protein
MRDIKKLDINDNEDTQVDCESTIVKASPLTFLILPPEIRRLVYRYLVPDTEEIISCWRPRHLRRDRENCAPNFLRINKQIYYELIEMWYGISTFRIQIGQLGLSYPNSIYEHVDNLPSTIQHIKTAQLRVQMKHPWSKGQTDYDPSMTALVDHILRAPRSLLRVQIVLEITSAYYRKSLSFRKLGAGEWTKGLIENSIQKGLEYNLGSLKKLNGLQIEWWHVFIPKPAFRYGLTTDDEFINVLMTFSDKAHDYLQTVQGNDIKLAYRSLIME